MYTYDVEEYETKEYIDMQDKRIAELENSKANQSDIDELTEAIERGLSL